MTLEPSIVTELDRFIGRASWLNLSRSEIVEALLESFVKKASADGVEEERMRGYLIEWRKSRGVSS